MLPAQAAGRAKRYGRALTLQPGWLDSRIGVMGKILIYKFREGTEERTKLIRTAPAELIEGNDWGDVYWGRCAGVGENNLGKLLMEIRHCAIWNTSTTP